ncbi:hypothetical protein GOP47_0025349 [Adiantum capillus-veneris]|uniref:Uncharacterized protein n=1 Tax=Adiantum capillus-veneris TaxID=13818 RepID=A0A9D4U0H6_ADICA|nr:hypothetical protein GOP47_0025349 [Adiantum capillus-veneris]
MKEMRRSTSEQGAPDVYVFALDHYTADCFVDANINNTTLARGTFKDTHGKKIRIDVPTTSFFGLTSLNPQASFIWESLCLEVYFALAPWGPNLQRAWEMYNTLNTQLQFTIMDFQGKPQNFRLIRQLVSEALHLLAHDVHFNEKQQKVEYRYLTADVAEPRWDELKVQDIRLPL